DDRGEGRAIWHLDVAFRHTMLTDDILRLVELFRAGAISAEDLEQAIHEAVLATLTDRFGQSLPERLLMLLERYIELVMQQIAGETAAGAAGAAEVGHATQSQV